MARTAKKTGAAKKSQAAKKPGTRKVVHRFRGIDRSASKAVYALESRLALTQRHLKAALKRVGRASLIDEAYQRLTPGNRRRLIEQATLLKLAQK